MNYYEELGISEEATEQEIRKAHRRLVKLMHPDAQPDPKLKQMAETQMRRLNSIVSTLLDAEQRSAYDRELVAAQSSDRAIAPSSWQGIPWWLASAVGAVALTLVAVWLWADHIGTNFGNKPAETVYVPTLDSHSPAAGTTKGSSNVSPGSRDGANVGASYKASGGATAESRSVSDEASGGGGISATVISDAPAIIAPPKVKPSTVPENKSGSNGPAGKPTPEVTPKAVVLKTPMIRKEAVQANRSGKRKPEKPQLTATRKEPPPKQLKSPQHLESHTQPATGDSLAVGTSQRKVFALPSGSLIASAALPGGRNPMPPPPGVTPPASSHDYNPIPSSSLPAAGPPPKLADVTTSASAAPGRTGMMNPRDPLEGEWVYAPKEPERRRAGFYPPEFIDLKLFGVGDAGNLRGQYSAKYLVTDKPVAPEVTFDLASMTKGSRKFVWQNSSGARGTLSIDPIDERTIRIDWHTTTSTRAPALTSGQATLVRRQ